MLTYISSHIPSTDDIILSSINLTLFLYFMRSSDPLESSFQNLRFTPFLSPFFQAFSSGSVSQLNSGLLTIYCLKLFCAP